MQKICQRIIVVIRMNKKLLALKFFMYLFGLTVYNFLYENYLNDMIINSIHDARYYISNSTYLFSN